MPTSPARVLESDDPEPSGKQPRAVVSTDLGYEEDELTIRRDFTPKPPKRVEVEISDADKTWKWTRPRADDAGRFVGLALPTPDDAHLAEFDHDDVEATLEMATPFALQPPRPSREEPIPLVSTPHARARASRGKFSRTAEWFTVVLRRPQVRAGAAFVAAAIVAFCVAYLLAR